MMMPDYSAFLILLGVDACSRYFVALGGFGGW